MTEPVPLNKILARLQRVLDAVARGKNRDVEPEGWRRRRRAAQMRRLFDALAPFAESLEEGREVRTTQGGTRRVRAWRLPQAVYQLASTPTEAQAKRKQTGLTLIHAAIALGDAPSVNWLLRAGFSCSEYALGRPPMGYAYYDDRPRAVRLLWQHGASHEHTFRDVPGLPVSLRGSTQFHRLLERGAGGLDPNEYATEAQRLKDRCEVARFFAATYANPMARNAQGKTAFDLAPRGDVVAEAAHAVVAQREAHTLEEALPDTAPAPKAGSRARM